MSPAGAEVAPRHQGVLVQEIAELGFAEPELVEEGSNVQPHDRPDDDRLMRSADTVADRKHAKLNLAAIASSQTGTMRRTGKFPPARHGLVSARVTELAAETAETLGPNAVGTKYSWGQCSWGQCRWGQMPAARETAHFADPTARAAMAWRCGVRR